MRRCIKRVPADELTGGRVVLGRKAIRTAEEKLSVVLAVLRGEMTQVEVARRLELSQTTVSKWLKQFTEGGRERLARGDNARAGQ